jgi:hypothetical protein
MTARSSPEPNSRATARVRPYAGRWHPQSIARWLTLHYVGWTAALFCLAIAFLYPKFRS